MTWVDVRELYHAQCIAKRTNIDTNVIINGGGDGSLAKDTNNAAQDNQETHIVNNNTVINEQQVHIQYVFINADGTKEIRNETNLNEVPQSSLLEM